MDWNKGFSASYYATFVDKATWRDIERFEITDGSISFSDDELRCSAQISVTSYEHGTERLIRIYLDARQKGSAELVPLFTGYATSPAQNYNGVLETNNLEIYSVLVPVRDVVLPRGWYAPAEISTAHILKSLFAPTPAPLDIADNAPALSEAIIAEDDETNLSMIDKILTAINWRLRILGDGTIQILPIAVAAVASYDPLENDAIEPEIEISYDWYECPNCFRAISGDLSATARDDDTSSQLSTVNRGREVWMVETDCDLAEDESIGSYAQRRLKEEQSVATTAKYKRRFNPDITITDLIRHHYPEQNMDGLYKVNSIAMDLSYGGTVDEEVTKYE